MILSHDHKSIVMCGQKCFLCWSCIVDFRPILPVLISYQIAQVADNSVPPDHEAIVYQRLTSQLGSLGWYPLYSWVVGAHFRLQGHKERLSAVHIKPATCVLRGHNANRFR